MTKNIADDKDATPDCHQDEFHGYQGERDEDTSDEAKA
jgi:hypothetical protein